MWPGASVESYIEAPPERVWALISDVKRMAEWSPECVGAEWLPPSQRALPGARFRGRSRRGRFQRWSRECEVTAAAPGELFAFSTLWRGGDATRWRYELTREGAGTRIVESCALTGRMPRWVKVGYMLMGRRRALEVRAGMEDTLARLKKVAESD